MEFKPFGKYMVAKQEEITASKGGIELPTAVKMKLAKILDIGHEIENKDLKGARVMFAHCSPIILNEEQFILLTEKDILGVFSSPTAP